MSKCLCIFVRIFGCMHVCFLHCVYTTHATHTHTRTRQYVDMVVCAKRCVRASISVSVNVFCFYIFTEYPTLTARAYAIRSRSFVVRWMAMNGMEFMLVCVEYAISRVCLVTYSCAHVSVCVFIYIIQLICVVFLLRTQPVER